MDNVKSIKSIVDPCEVRIKLNEMKWKENKKGKEKKERTEKAKQ